MDTSEIYIKMCEKAVKIQELRQWEYYDNELSKVTREGNYLEGDTVCADGEIVVLGHTPYKPAEYSKYGLDISMVGYDEGDSLGGVEKLIWLPRQDDLQKMVGATSLWNLNHKFSTWLYDTETFEHTCGDWIDMHVRHAHLEFTTMEQLWLAAIMDWKFNKVWNGEDWVKGH